MTATHLITGGAGFIGSHLVEGLLSRGASVRVLDDFSTGRRENLAAFSRERLEVIEGDLRHLPTVRRAAKGVDTIFHEGALPSVARSVEDPAASNEINVGGTIHALLAARDEGVRRVVFASSSSVYGDAPALPKVEMMEPQPLSPYAVQKLACEGYARIAKALWGVEVVSLRYFNVFGPRQDPKSQYAAVIPRFIAALLRGEPPAIFGDGLQSRDFTFVENVVAANLKAAEASSEVAGHVFNVACGERFTLLDLAGALARLMGRGDVEPRFAPARPGDVRHSQASIEKAKRLLGWTPHVPFEEGLRRTLDWYAGAARR